MDTECYMLMADNDGMTILTMVNHTTNKTMVSELANGWLMVNNLVNDD